MPMNIKRLYTASMGRSKLHLPPLDSGGETLGERIARLRKERGYTQTELAERNGIIQALVSDYERGKLRLNPEMVVRFAGALEASTEDILRPNGSRPLARKPSRRVLRRPEQIESLSPHKQRILPSTIDTFLRAG
jgi:transcriptional regulator with XRE-family HTH domain